jgi:polysaccharide biosynthesis transport protein
LNRANDLLGYLRILRRWIWLIVGISFLAAATSAAVSFQLPKQYESTTVALVNPKQGLLTSADAGIAVQLDQLVQTYVQLVNIEPVRQHLISDGVPRGSLQLQKELTAKREPNTTLIEITVRDRDPKVAYEVARDIIPSFNSSLDAIQTSVLGKATTSRLDSMVPAQIPPAAPTVPVSPNILLNTAAALVAGLLISTGLVILFERLDNTIHTEADVRTELALTPLGSIARTVQKQRGRAANGVMALTTMTHPMDSVSEAYKAIRTSLLFSSTDKPLRTLIVTSTAPGEGKTSTACNLAVVMAQAGNRVILVDADFRRPALSKIFRLPDNFGLGNLVLGDRSLDEILAATEVPNLKVMGTGPIPPNPSELLSSRSMAAILLRLAAAADFVIFDTPPVAAVTDATVLASKCDGVIIVVEEGRTQCPAVIRTRDTLVSVNARVVGVVLNKQRARDTSDGYYYYTPNASLVAPTSPGRQEPSKRPDVAHHRARATIATNGAISVPSSGVPSPSLRAYSPEASQLVPGVATEGAPARPFESADSPLENGLSAEPRPSTSSQPTMPMTPAPPADPAAESRLTGS